MIERDLEYEKRARKEVLQNAFNRSVTGQTGLDQMPEENHAGIYGPDSIYKDLKAGVLPPAPVLNEAGLFCFDDYAILAVIVLGSMSLAWFAM